MGPEQAEYYLFGVSGAAGDGILKAALADPNVGTIQVITRRSTPRIEVGVRDISEDSSMHWAREKARAETELLALAEGTKLDVIAWRPGYIGTTEEEAHLGQDLLYWFFAPVGAAVRAQQIGEAMLEVTVRGDELGNGNGDRLATRKILRYAKAYHQRKLRKLVSNLAPIAP